jgi:uracil-DNA glycosylase family 4
MAKNLKNRPNILHDRSLNCEEHLCNKEMPLDKYLQLGKGKGRHILAIAESPSVNGWRKSGRAFYDSAGRLVPTGKNFLDYLKQIDGKFNISNVSFTEIAKCFINNDRKKLDACAAKTWPHLLKQIDFANPRLIILLGKKTTDIFNKLSGSDLDIGDIREITLKDRSYFIFPIYHPSPANPSRALNKEIIQKSVEFIRKLIKDK